MQDLTNMTPGPAADTTNENAPDGAEATLDSVSTHVLVSEEQVGKLRELARKTRVAQSEYLREAVDDLLGKYGKDGKAPSK